MRNIIMSQVYGSLLRGITFKNNVSSTSFVQCVRLLSTTNATNSIHHNIPKMLDRNLLHITKRQGIIINDRKFCTNPRLATQLMDFPIYSTTGPILWLRKLFNEFIIKNLDNEFDMREFVKSAKTALVVVAGLLSRQQFSELDGLLSNECREEVENNVRAMNPSQRRDLVVEMDDIVMAFPHSSRISRGGSEGDKVFFEITVVYHIYENLKSVLQANALANITMGDPQKLTLYNCRFIREFTQGVEGPWIINGINLYKVKEAYESEKRLE